MNNNTLSIYTFIISSLLLLSSQAQASDSSYISVQVGAAVPNSKLTHETADAGLIKKAPKNAVVFDIAGGTKVLANTYAELEVAYADHKFNSNYQDSNFSTLLHSTSFKTRLQTMSGFANLSYRFANLDLPVIPYVTAGVGLSSNKVKNMSISSPSFNIFYNASGKTKTQAAWQVGAGLLMPITNSLSINLSYKYRDLGKIKTTNILTNGNGGSETAPTPLLQGRVRTSNILLGVDFKF